MHYLYYFQILLHLYTLYFQKKFDYFLNEIDGLFSIFTRSTIYVSLFYGQYTRFAFTLVLLSFLLILPTIFLSYIKNINDKRNNLAHANSIKSFKDISNEVSGLIFQYESQIINKK